MLRTSLSLALRQITRHAMRSFLTVLGVVIGVFSVITMVTLGNGVTSAVRTSISALGSDVVQVRPGQSAGPGGGGIGGAPFKLADAEAIRDQVGGVTAVAPVVQAQGVAVRNAQNWTTTITGASNSYFAIQKISPATGRSFSAMEEQSGRSVCVIGETIVRNLFQDEDPLGQSLRVRGVSCQIIGVLAARGQGGFGDQDDLIIMPIKAVQRQITGSQNVTSMSVGVDPTFDNKAVQAGIRQVLRERRTLSAGQEDDFNLVDARQIADTVSNTVQLLTLLIGAVAGISLLVGGIGIMNIMLVSVTERTREIGLRLAIGAQSEDVLSQFLVESVVLSCIGGLIGMVLAFAVSALATPAMGVPFLFDLGVNLVAFGFSALIGIVFGYMPARRAANLDPIEALRYD
jgi:putative ABC transport system permease protein